MQKRWTIAAIAVGLVVLVVLGGVGLVRSLDDSENPATTHAEESQRNEVAGREAEGSEGSGEHDSNEREDTKEDASENEREGSREDPSGGEGEHAGSEGSGEHGANERTGSGESSEDDGEESGTQLTKQQTYDHLRAGSRLIIAYDPAANVFSGTVRNITDATLNRVRIEIHLSNGIELGPTTPADLPPGGVMDVTLPASAQPFDTWSAHAEVGGGDSGSEDSGEHDSNERENSAERDGDDRGGHDDGA